jgi:hypothetical protein
MHVPSINHSKAYHLYPSSKAKFSIKGKRKAQAVYNPFDKCTLHAKIALRNGTAL